MAKQRRLETVGKKHEIHEQRRAPDMPGHDAVQQDLAEAPPDFGVLAAFASQAASGSGKLTTSAAKVKKAVDGGSSDDFDSEAPTLEEQAGLYDEAFGGFQTGAAKAQGTAAPDGSDPDKEAAELEASRFELGRTLANSLALATFNGKAVTGQGTGVLPEGELAPFVGERVDALGGTLDHVSAITAAGLSNKDATGSAAQAAARAIAALIGGAEPSEHAYLWAVAAASKLSSEGKGHLAQLSPVPLDAWGVAPADVKAPKKEDNGWAGWGGPMLGLLGLDTDADSDAWDKKAVTSSIDGQATKDALSANGSVKVADDLGTTTSASGSLKHTTEGLEGSGKADQTTVLEDKRADDDWDKLTTQKSGSVAYTAKDGLQGTAGASQVAENQYGTQTVKQSDSLELGLTQQGGSAKAASSTVLDDDGVSTSESLQGDLAYDAKKGTTAKVAFQTAIADGKDYGEKKHVSAGFDKGKASVEAGTELTTTGDDGVRQTTTKTAGGTVGKDRVQGDASYKVTEVDDEVAVTQGVSGQLKMAKGALSASGTAEHTVKVDGYEHARQASTSVSADGVTSGYGESTAYLDVAGVKRTESTTGFVHVGGEQAAIGGTRSFLSENADGSAKATAVSGSVNTDGQLSGGVSFVDRDTTQSSGKQGASSQTTVGGMIDLNSQGGIEGAAGAVKHKFKGGHTVSGSGGYSFKMGQPKPLEDGRWSVSWVQFAHGSAGGGASGTQDVKGAAGNAASLDLSVNGSVVSDGQRLFDSLADAEAWMASPDLDALAKPPTTTDDALKMAEGDASRTLMNLGAGVTGSARWGLATASAGASADATHGLQVERGQGATVFVTVTDSDTLKGQLGLSAAGLIGLGASTKQTDTEIEKLSFDLSVDAAAVAYERYVKTKAIDAGVDGVEVVMRSVGEEEVDGQDVQFGLVEMKSRQSVEQKITQRGDTRVEEETGTNSWSVSTLWGAIFGESHEGTLSQVDDQNQFITSTSKVDGHDAGDSYAGLARAAGIDGATNDVQGESSGSWQVETAFTDGAVEQFVDQVLHGDYNPHDGAMLDKHGYVLRDALAAAGSDPDQQRLAIAQFIAAGGDKALAQVREHTEGEQQFLDLDGSDVFTGYDGYQKLQRDLARLNAQLSDITSDKKALYDEVRAIRAQELTKEAELTDFSKYPDLPPPLRATEMERNAEALEQLDRLNAVLVGALREHAEASGESLSGVTKELDASRERSELAEWAMEEAYDEARHSKWVHDGAFSSTTSARDNLDHAGLFGTTWGQGSEVEAYDEADALYAEAEGHRRDGFEDALNAERRDLLDKADAVVAVDDYRAAERHFMDSAEDFLEAEEHFAEIEERHGEKLGYWGGNTKDLPEGA